MPYDVSASLPKLSSTLGDQHMPSFFVLSPDIVSVHWDSMGKLLFLRSSPCHQLLESSSLAQNHQGIARVMCLQ